MLVRLSSVVLVGIQPHPCEVEVDVSGRGFVGPTIVGLPDAAVKESAHRIKTALLNCGFAFPRSSCVINLAPATLRKEGPAFDLPIAVGLVFAGSQLDDRCLRGCMVVGELALDGRVRPVRGALSAALLARDRGCRTLILPLTNAPEAAVVEGIDVIGVATLTDAVGHLSGASPLSPTEVDVAALLDAPDGYEVDFADVRGQDHVKRALLIAAAGGHNILLVGPPGSGKTMLSRRLPTILPPLDLGEALQTTQIYSAAGKLPPGVALLAKRPWRAPHHTASRPALIGGGTVPQAGEVSLAHHGVLFLDEFPEFMRSILETLRQPLEEGRVTIARARGAVEFPARFMLVTAMNPCPCGYLTDPQRPCKCSAAQIERYMGRVSGPLVDRIDLHVEVPTVPFRELRTRCGGTPSAELRRRVLAARTVQAARATAGQVELNARLSSRAIRRICPLPRASEGILRRAMTELGLSARAHDKVLKVARTIADLAGEEAIAPDHVTEAIHYRRLDRPL